VKVSVIIPCLDAQAYLGTAIGSLLRQTHAPHEIIVADNGSRDRSRAIARSFGGRVRLVEVPERGASRARLAGLAEASGEALMFCDADDLLAPETLAALVGALGAGEGDIACAPWYRFERSGGAWHWAPPSCAPRHAGEDDLAAWLGGWYHPPCSVLWSRAAYDLSGGWDPDLAVNQDGDVMMKALARGAVLARTAQGAAFYRRLPEGGSLSAKARSTAGIAARLEVTERVMGILDESGRLAAYAAPLARALRRIVADIPPEAYDLTERGARLVARVGEAPPMPTGQATLPTGSGPPGPGPAPVPRAAARSEEPAPLVSVVIPAFNRAHTIERAIASVRAQNHAPIEIIVVDDGSIDATAAVARRAGGEQLRVVWQANAGAAAARNRGIAEARGDYIAFLDSDDEWRPGKLAAQLAKFRAAGPRLGLVYCGYESIAADGRRTVHQAQARGWIYRDLLAGNVVTGCGSTAMFRREALTLVGGFDTGLAANEDYDLVLRVARFFAADCVAAPLAVYHDAAPVSGSGVRVSRNAAANRASRAVLLQRYGADMQRAGVLHLFHISSAQRELYLAGTSARALRSAGKALLSRPFSPFAYRWAVTMFLPQIGRQLLAGRQAP
jgi:glycosyltransferase involved in cell wall biosynthesis